ncbi:MAG: AsmA family protein [Pseudomonadota bacterium]
MMTRFDSGGGRFALREAIIEGTELSARATASVEVGDDTLTMSAKLESGFLDIDRYLPPTSSSSSSSETERAASAIQDDDPLAMLPGEALDLSGLRELIADIEVAIDGIAMAGYRAGPIRLNAIAKDGLIEADLDEIGLYDGTIGGSLRLDAGSAELAARTNLIIANVDVGALAIVAASGTPPVVGNASGRLLGSTSGTTPRELVRNLTGEIDASLESEGGPEIAGQLTALSLAFKRPNVGADGRLRGSAVYGGEDIVFDIKTDHPVETLMLGDPINVDLSIESDVLMTSYLGRLVPTPIASLDGEWQAEIPSVAAFAAWLGKPLPEGQEDPGAIQVQASFRSDGASGAIEDANLQGQGLDLHATGSFDASGEIPHFELVLSGGVLQLDRYIPAGDATSGEAAASDGAGDTKASISDPLAALSDEPIDLSPLRAQEGRIRVSLGGIQVAGVDVGAIELQGTLEDGKLAIVLDKLNVADGTINARLDVDGSGDALGIDGELQAANVRAKQLEALLSGSQLAIEGPASAEAKLSSSGSSVRQLVTGAVGAIQFDLPGMTLGEGPIARVAATNASLDLAGIDEGPRISAATTLTPRAGGVPVSADVKAQFGPLRELLANASLPMDIEAQIGKLAMAVTGHVADLDRSPTPELEIRLNARQLSDLETLAGTELPDAGPVSLSGQLTTENDLYRISDLAARISRSDLGGEITLQLGEDRPRLTADLSSELIDVNELIGQAEPAQRDADGQAGTASADQAKDEEAEPDQAAPRLIPDDPLPFEALGALDADVKLAITKLKTHVGSDANDLFAQIELTDGDLHVTPLRGKSAGGDFEVNLDVLNRGQTADLKLDMQFNQWVMGTFSDIIRSSSGSVGKLDATIQLEGSGRSPHAIASSLDGEVKLVGKGGAVDSTVMQVLSIGLGSLFDVFGDNKESTFLNCFVVRFDFEDGIGTAHDFLVDFPDISIIGTGTIDLTDEQIDLLFRPDSKNQSFVSLAVPFDVAGPLASPSIRPDPTGSGIQLLKGAGLALLFLNPITVLPAAAAAGAIIGTGMIQDAASENPCVAALRNAEAVDQAKPDEGWFDSLKSALGAD